MLSSGAVAFTPTMPFSSMTSPTRTSDGRFASHGYSSHMLPVMGMLPPLAHHTSEYRLMPSQPMPMQYGPQRVFRPLPQPPADHAFALRHGSAMRRDPPFMPTGDEAFQSKPPSEQVLETMASPCRASGGSVTPTKARVALPPTPSASPSKKAAERPAPKKAKKPGRKGQKTPVEQPKMDDKGRRVEDAVADAFAKQGANETREKDKEEALPKQENTSLPPKESVAKKDIVQTCDTAKEHVLPQHDNHTKPSKKEKESTTQSNGEGLGELATDSTTEAEPAAKTTGSDMTPEPQDNVEKTHKRTLSIFTEEQIKARQQAWNRIPMPLDARRVSKPVPSAGAIVAANTQKIVQVQKPRPGPTPSGLPDTEIQGVPPRPTGPAPIPATSANEKDIKGPRQNQPKKAAARKGENAAEDSGRASQASLRSKADKMATKAESVPSRSRPGSRASKHEGDPERPVGTLPAVEPSKSQKKKKKNNKRAADKARKEAEDAAVALEGGKQPDIAVMPELTDQPKPNEEAGSSAAAASQRPSSTSTPLVKPRQPDYIEDYAQPAAKRIKEDKRKEELSEAGSSRDFATQLTISPAQQACFGKGGSIRLERKRPRPLPPIPGEANTQTEPAPPSSSFDFASKAMPKTQRITTPQKDARGWPDLPGGAAQKDAVKAQGPAGSGSRNASSGKSPADE